MTTRIQLNDLPCLKDLTPEQLKELFGAGRFKPSFEQLETRLVPADLFTALSVDYTYDTATIAATTAPAQTVDTSFSTTDGTSTITAQTAGTTQETTDGTSTITAQTDGTTQETTDGTSTIVAQPDYTEDYGASIYDQPELSSPALDWGVPSTDPVYEGADALQVRSFESQEQGRVAIANKVSALRTFLGQPLAGFEESQPTADGYGRYQVFNGNSIYWSPATAKIDKDLGLNPTTEGAHLIAGAIRDRYFNMGATQFGYPTKDTLNLRGWAGATFNDFYNPESKTFSSIVHTSATGAHILSGPIRSKWIQLGAGDYGVPRTDQYVSHGALSQDFRWGSPVRPISTIVWSSRTGAHDVVGVMRDKWISVGREKFGLPWRDQTVPGSGSVRSILDFVKPTRVLHDDGSESWREDWSAIVLHDPTLPYATGPANVIYGDIYYAWNSFGRETFGIPVTDEDNDLGGGRFQFFNQQGRTRGIYWNDGTIYLEDSNGVLQAASFEKGPPRFESTGTTSPTFFSSALAGLNELEPQATEDVLAQTVALGDAAQLDRDLGLQFTGDYWQNWLGRDEKWLQGDDGRWYFIEPSGAFSRWLQGADSELLATLDPSIYQDPATRLAAADLAVQAAAEIQRLTQEIQTANQVLAAAEQTLASKAANLAQADIALAPFQAQAQQSAQAYQSQVDLGRALQAKVSLATTAYQLAVRAQRANRVVSLRPRFQLAVSKAKARLDAAIKAFNLQKATILAAQTAMNADALALQPLAAARDLALQELDAALQARNQTALQVADLESALAQAQAAQQEVAGDATASRAAQLVRDLGLGSYHPEWTADNWLGRDERWILSDSNQWYFITPDGGLFRYGGSQEANHALLATLDHSYWEDLNKLLNAADPLAPTVAAEPVLAQPEADALAQQVADLQALATQLIGDLGLGSYHPEWTADNWLGRDERWILSDSNQWYFITPDGGLYRYGGSAADSSLLATLDHSYWENLDKLISA